MNGELGTMMRNMPAFDEHAASPLALQSRSGFDPNVRANVLCIDDNRELLECCGNLLRRHNFQVQTALRALDAIACFQSRRTDLILMDLHLPEMDGDQLAQMLRVLNPATRLVLFAGGPVPTESLLHFDAYVPKTEVAHLFDVMDELLGSVARTMPLSHLNGSEFSPASYM